MGASPSHLIETDPKEFQHTDLRIRLPLDVWKEIARCAGLSSFYKFLCYSSKKTPAPLLKTLFGLCAQRTQKSTDFAAVRDYLQLHPGSSVQDAKEALGELQRAQVTLLQVRHQVLQESLQGGILQESHRDVSFFAQIKGSELCIGYYRWTKDPLPSSWMGFTLVEHPAPTYPSSSSFFSNPFKIGMLD